MCATNIQSVAETASGNDVICFSVLCICSTLSLLLCSDVLYCTVLNYTVLHSTHSVSYRMQHFTAL